MGAEPYGRVQRLLGEGAGQPGRARASWEGQGVFLGLVQGRLGGPMGFLGRGQGKLGAPPGLQNRGQGKLGVPRVFFGRGGGQLGGLQGCQEGAQGNLAGRTDFNTNPWIFYRFCGDVKLDPGRATWTPDIMRWQAGCPLRGPSETQMDPRYMLMAPT